VKHGGVQLHPLAPDHGRDALGARTQTRVHRAVRASARAGLEDDAELLRAFRLDDLEVQRC
jgi:hypothetical protein